MRLLIAGTDTRHTTRHARVAIGVLGARRRQHRTRTLRPPDTAQRDARRQREERPSTFRSHTHRAHGEVKTPDKQLFLLVKHNIS